MDDQSVKPNAFVAQPSGVQTPAGCRPTGVRVSAYDHLQLYIGCTSLAIMALVAAFAFSPVRALALGLVMAVILGLAFRDRHGADPASSGLADPWLIATLLLALFLRADISTNYQGELDPGLYVALSGVIEHTGGPYFSDLFHAGLPDQLKALYERAIVASAAPLGDGLRYEIAFYPLHPGWMAVFSGLLGADAHGRSVLMFSLLGVTGAYFLARELGKGAGVAEARLAAALTAVNPALCYLAKMPLSEAPATAFIMNAAYLLAKALRTEGRAQILLLGTSLLLLIGFFFTRLSFPLLLVPALALYVFSYSGRLGAIAAKRLRFYLWLTAAGLALALLLYHAMLPRLFRDVSDMYFGLLGRHPYYLLAAASFVMLGLLAAAATPLRSRFALAPEYAARASERAAPWLPAVLVLAGVPGMIAVARSGTLYFPGAIEPTLEIVPDPTAFRYHLLYRLVLALTPFLLGILVALPCLVRNKPRLTIPLLFLGAAWAFTQAFSPMLPNLYYHIRFIASEVIPFSLVILSVVLVAMVRSGRYRRLLAVTAGLAALAMMIAFSAVQLGNREGEDPRFFREIDARVSDNDVIVMSEREAGSRVALPLRYYFNKQVFLLPRDATPADTRDLVRYLLANAGSGYGRVLVLSSLSAPALPFDVTLLAPLQLTESGISNSENFRFDPFQSNDVRHMLLPTMWRTNVQTLYLYRVKTVSNPGTSAGCSIDFSSWGNSWTYTRFGWGGQESSYRWALGPEAFLRITPAADTSDLRRMQLNAMAFVREGQSQRVEVLVDANKAAELTVDGTWRDYDIGLGRPVRPGKHTISFRLPDARSPRSAGVGDDSRVLGIAVTSMTFLSSDGSPGRCE
jgi:hypothetical protein